MDERELFKGWYMPTKITIDDWILKKEKLNLPERYIINENATILFWENGEKTVVRKCEDDEFNPRLGFLTAFFQHYCGMSKNKANKYLASLTTEVEGEVQKEKIYKVIDIGETYATYKSFSEKYFPKYKKYFKPSEKPSLNKNYRLIGTHQHDSFNRMLCLIQDIQTNQVYIIDKQGIKEE